MRVLSLPKLRAFWERHAQAESPLRTWFNTLIAASPRHLNDMKQTFGSVDYVPDKKDSVGWHVFNVGGNNVRVICKVDYVTQYTLIKHVFTHEQYNDWTKENR